MLSPPFFAKYVSHALYIDEKTGVVGEAPVSDAVELYCFMRYYGEIELPPVTEADAIALYDKIWQADAAGADVYLMHPDFGRAMNMARNMQEIVARTVERRTELGVMLKGMATDPEAVSALGDALIEGARKDGAPAFPLPGGGAAGKLPLTAFAKKNKSEGAS